MARNAGRQARNWRTISLVLLALCVALIARDRGCDQFGGSAPRSSDFQAARPLWGRTPRLVSEPAEAPTAESGSTGRGDPDRATLSDPESAHDGYWNSALGPSFAEFATPFIRYLSPGETFDFVVERNAPPLYAVEFRPGVQVIVDRDGLPRIGEFDGQPTDIGTRLVEFDPPFRLSPNSRIRFVNTNGDMSGVAYIRLD